MVRKPPIWPKRTVVYGGRQGGKMLNYLLQAEAAARAMEQHRADLIADGYTVDGDGAYKVTAEGAGFISGRMVSLRPNPMFNIGIDVARVGSDETVMVEVDYSGLERRIVAWYTGDEAIDRYTRACQDDAPNSVTGGQDF